jgi:hypothetical protein
MKRLIGAIGAFSVAVVALLLSLSPRDAMSQTGTPYTYDGAKLAGTWTVTMTTVLSTCDNDPAGSTSGNVWTVTYNDEILTAKSSTGNVFEGFSPTLENKKYKMYLHLKSTPKQSVYDLTMDSKTKNFSGRLIAAMKDDDGSPCTKLLNVQLKK